MASPLSLRPAPRARARLRAALLSAARLRAALLSAALLAPALLAPQAASAYVGPGAGLTAIGGMLALVAAVLLAIAGFVWYPLKRLLRGRRAGTTVAETPPAASIEPAAPPSPAAPVSRERPEPGAPETAGARDR
ncbi:hypothetical protein [Albimonas pacifica]|uniref:Uncharacterized protein n=1 Tax=Albimonas pacifica TaxID=1114924 RepID=A0A1I3DC23_9RHOB|nr:hypothetical protein [Albimonas pacifica]SFH84275.1 hypothetical protein SAMN05216258_102503 [Albimonas pacifica]